MIRNKCLMVYLIILLATVFSGCSGGGNSTTTSATSSAVSGAVAKGSIIGATIDLYSIAVDGYSLGARVNTGAPIVTDAYGEWNANVPDSTVRPLIIVSHGGYYIDEYTGNRVDLTPQDEMKGILDTGTTAAITPFTDAMVKTIKQLAIDGYGSNNFANDVAKVKYQYQNMLGFDPVNTLPPHPDKVGGAGITPQQKEYAAVLGGFSKIVSDMYAAAPGASTANIIKKLTDDLGSDLQINGIGLNNTKIQTPGLDLYAHFSPAPADLYTATQQYQQQGINVPPAVKIQTPAIKPGNFQILTDTTPPVIALNGVNPVAVEAGQVFMDAYATVTDNVDVVNNALIGTGVVNSTVPGVYTISYNAVDTAGNIALQKQRTVNVVDTTLPIISLNGINPVIISVGQTYADANGTVTDNVDATNTTLAGISTVNMAVPGTYTVSYNHTDVAGNTAIQMIRDVYVQDNAIPIITVNGANPATLEAGQSYVDSYGTVTDNVDATITTLSGVSTVNSNAPGAYTVTYNHTDSSGNPATQVQRTVNVVDTTAPTIVVNGTNPLTLNAGQVYVDAYATVTDIVDATITSLVGTSTVNAHVPGTYTVTYNHSDAAGNPAAQAVRTVTVLGTVQQGRADMNAGTATPAKGNFASVLAQNPANLEAALGICIATLGEVSGDAALRTLLGKFTTDAGASLPTSVQVTKELMGNVVNKAPVNWAKTGPQLVTAAVNASLLQDPAIDAVKIGITTCINQVEMIKATNFTTQMIAQGLQNVVWDRSDLEAVLSLAYGVRGGIDWARAYNWSTDVDNDSIPDTQVLNFIAADTYTYQYRTVGIDPV